MDIKELILKELNKRGEITTSQIVKKTGFTRSYINRFFQDLSEEGRIILIGKTRRSKYVLLNKKNILSSKKKILSYFATLSNENLKEHEVLDTIKNDTGIFINLPENNKDILDYAFTEMLNNAIEHSRSKKIVVSFKREQDVIRFDVVDNGIGIFNNIIQKYSLSNEMDAIEYLLKGKTTTAEREHTGEGIYFTSKAADNLLIYSSKKKLIFNNIIEDIIIKDSKYFKGTKITFHVSSRSAKLLTDIFNRYTDEAYQFSKTEIKVKLYKHGAEYFSRSQARRIISGLDKFKTIRLDFTDVETVGQGFADEIFRVWKRDHPDIELIPINPNENIRIMIDRAKAS